MTTAKTVMLALLATFALALMAPTTALAQEDDGDAAEATEATADAAPAVDERASMGKGLAAMGAGLALIGGGIGIGLIGRAANESVARQPEASGNIFTQTIITAAFIEGATLFAVLTAFLA